MDFQHTSIKQSALGWVKKSIDDNLATIRSALNGYIEDKDASALDQVQQQLGDIQGVLTMIEQFGAAMLTEEMKSLCGFIASKEQQDEQALEVLLRSVLQLPDYLEHIQSGQKDIPIAILPLLNDIRAAKNQDLFSEKLLFLPDLSMHTDDIDLEAIDDSMNQSSQILARKLRPTYQFSLLGLIRDKDLDTNMARLAKISEVMEERSQSEQMARFWWIVGALIESISRSNLALGVSVKMLLGKVDAVLRLMTLKGEREALAHQPVELIKNLLYYIAQPECDGPKSQAIKTAYRLERFLPTAEDQSRGMVGPNLELLKTVSEAVKADLEKVKSTLEVYVNGDMAETGQLSDVPSELHVISDTLAMIGMGSQRQLIEAQIKMVNEVIEGHTAPEQDRLLNMAAELIQVDQALDLLQKGQYHETDDGDQATSSSASKNFEMDNMLTGVISAALDDIQKIKGAILDFIKDSTREENLTFSATLLHETRGALQLLNQDKAVQVTDGLLNYLEEHDVVDFMDADRLDQLSQVVVSIEYYLEALGEQRSDAESILDFADSQLELLLQGRRQVESHGIDGEREQENLLIEDDQDDVEIIDEAELQGVDLANMNDDLQDKLPEESTSSSDQQDNNLIVDDISQGLEQIQDVLAADDELPDAGLIEVDEQDGDDVEQIVESENDDAIAALQQSDSAPDDSPLFEQDIVDQQDELPQFDVTGAEDSSTIDYQSQNIDFSSEPQLVDVKDDEFETPPADESMEIEMPTDLMEAVSDEPEQTVEGPTSHSDELSIDDQADFSEQEELHDFGMDSPSVNDAGSQSLSEDVVENPIEQDQLIDAEIPPESFEESQPEAVDDDIVEQDDGVHIIPIEDDLPVLKPGADDDILEIYLEEAEEESESIQQQHQDWKMHPEDDNALKNIRRSFHTIKGSGRLVGAMKIGEFAWDFENLLNRVIDKSVEPTEQLIDAVGNAGQALPQLVEELKTQQPPQADIAYLRGVARALSEFKPEQIMELRQSRQPQTLPKSDASEEADEESEFAGLSQFQEESAPQMTGADETDQYDAAPSSEIINDSEISFDAPDASLITATNIDQASATADTQSEPDSQPEETPPDPFDSSEMTPMPGGEADPMLPATEPPPVAESLSQASQDPDQLQIDPELLVIYQQEVESHLNTVNSVLDNSNADNELIPTEDLYRAIHTIHGASRTANVTTIAQLASLMEKPLKAILEKGVGLDEEVLGLYRSARDELYRMTHSLVQNRSIPELPETLRDDLEGLCSQLNDHTVDLPDQNDQPSSHFVDTLTMMNESTEQDYDDELIEIFIDEAEELLEMSDHTLQAWVDQGDDEDEHDFSLVMELQRYLHTLKGGAKMADFKEISDLSHELESLFISVIDTRVEKTDELIDALHESFDLLTAQVDQAKNHQPIVTSENQINVLREIRSGKPSDQTTNPAQAEDSVTETNKGDSDESAQEDVAAAATAEERRHDDSPQALNRRASDQEVVKVRSELLDNLVNSAGEVSIYRARMEQQVSSFGANLGELGQTITRLKNQLRALEAETDAQIHFSHRQDAKIEQSFDPLEMDRYTQIQELSKALSESVDDLSSLQNILGDQVRDSETLLLQQSRINTDLQDGLIRSRMVRFSGVTSRLRRLVRKTSSELAKKAELKVSGDQNEVDIKVLDRMIAPLEHIIRNALTHGIESPVERVNKGKPETGLIQIDVSRDGSDVVIRVTDDGAGVNVDKVRSRALQLGLIDKNERHEDNDVIQFILEPGFSTADKVTQVAGRGVGMDVVDSGIKQLGGTLQILTSSKGTQFTARLPFTLSINQAILVRSGDESYAIPLVNIEGITRIESDQMQVFYQQDKPLLDYAGQQYNLHYLPSLLDNNRRFRVNDPEFKEPVILLRSGDLRIALHIDEILGNREIVVKPMGKLLGQVKGLAGATILADGMVVLILDVNGLVLQGVTTQLVSEDSLSNKEEEVASSEKVVMVVDDSITMRRVATKLLKRNDFGVVTAKDGVDALAKLEEIVPDVMLLDIEMPRMDGFELATQMRNDERFKSVPIIMITSRTGSKHRDHAMQIGVNMYMGKPYQEEELVGNISSLVR